MARPRSYKFMPTSETDIVHISMPKAIKKKLKIKAAMEGTTVTALIMEMIVKGMEAQKDERDNEHQRD